MSEPLPIPFNAGQASGLAELAGASPAFINLLVDKAGAIRRRPGIAAWADFPTAIPNASPVVQMVIWNDMLVYATEDRKLFAWRGPGLVQALSSSSSATQLDGGLRPVFATTRSLVVAAGGGVPQKWDGVTPLSARLGGSPPVLSHIAAISQRLVGSLADSSGTFQWTPAGSPEVWSALDSAEAEARPDKAVACRENTNEVWLFGTQTTQIFQPDANVIFRSGQTVNRGCLAAAGIIQIDEDFAWLDDRRRFVISSGGRGPQSLSTDTMQRSLEALGTVSDCWGARVHIDGADLLLWVFPTEGRSITYDIVTDKWGEWRSWSAGAWQPLMIRSYVFWPERNLHLVGLANGAIMRLDPKTFTENGQILKGHARTGRGNRGSENLKHSQAVALVMLRGQGTQGGTEPVVEISWRDDGGPFTQPLQVGLGNAGDVAVEQVLRSLGTYRGRQWQLEISDPVDWTLAGAMETVETLGS